MYIDTLAVFVEIIFYPASRAVTLSSEFNLNLCIMKTRFVLLTALVLVLLNGCVVKSLHRFYQEKDVVYKESLLGSWLDEDSTRWEIHPFVFSKGFMKGDSTDNSYLVELYEKDKAPQKFNAHLFTLNGRMYFDFIPLREDRYDDFLDIHLVATHSLALIDFGSHGEITIGWFNNEWLEDLFKENRVKISHEVIEGQTPDDNPEYILTASTEELQKFVEKYGVPGEKGLCVDDDNFLCIHLTKHE